MYVAIPDSKVHGTNMGPTWVLSAPDGPHVGPMNLVTRDVVLCTTMHTMYQFWIEFNWMVRKISHTAYWQVPKLNAVETVDAFSLMISQK